MRVHNKCLYADIVVIPTLSPLPLLIWSSDLRFLTCDFTSFSTVFQSYQDDGWVIMKGCVQWTPFMAGKISPQAGLELRIAR